MRTSLTNSLAVIKSDYEGKDINQKIKVPFNLREKFDFPKEMTIKKMREKQMLKALRHFKTVDEAAKALGISARTLYLFKLTLN